MKPHKDIRLSCWVRLVALSLLLGFGLATGNMLASRTAHAQAAATVTITDCIDDTQLRSAIANAASGDTITFGCSGTITLGSTLGISKNLTLDGSGQQVTLSGGGSVQVLSVNSGVSFTLNALTIAHGSAINVDGGALYNEGLVNISNSTFANNSVSTDAGGLYNDGTVSISNSTFANNLAPTGGGGLYNDNSGVLTSDGSIVANNTGGNCYNTGGISDQGYNLSSDSSCGFTGTGSLQNTNPMLASGLANNGGPTQTLALLDGSPAINKIPSGSSCPSTDQRGIARPQGPACDIGAFEFRVPVLKLPGTITVTATGPNGASVTYTATASEPDDSSATPTVSCSPASGSTFPIGTTTVNCTASDAATPPDATTGSFQVIVVGDTDLALTNMPTNITTNATSSQGAVVTYSLPTVVDEDSPLPTASCTPASGSTFAIGTTPVTCTVSDSDDSNSPVSQSFSVVVQPTLTVSVASVKATEGSAFNGVVATGTASGTSNALSASINWGDGSSTTGSVILNPDGSYSVSGSHTYTEEGSYALTVTVTESGSLSAKGNGSATVADAALTLTHFAAGPLEHRSAGVAAVFTDADPAGQVSDYTATITWGDGTTATVKVVKNPLGKGFVLAGLHSYASKGTYSVTLTVSDSGGSQLTKTVTITVK